MANTDPISQIAVAKRRLLNNFQETLYPTEGQTFSGYFNIKKHFAQFNVGWISTNQNLATFLNMTMGIRDSGVAIKINCFNASADAIGSRTIVLSVKYYCEFRNPIGL